MSDNIKLVECFYTPKNVFTIYDYTKIAYPVNNYICIREIVTPQIRPNFIKIQHQYKQIIDIHAFNTTITTIELNNQNQYCVGFYQSLQYLTKINSDLVNLTIQQNLQNSRQLQSIKQNIPTTIKHEFQYSQNNIFLLLSKKGKQATQMQNQLIVLSIKNKRVICKAFIPGTIINFFVKEDQFFTVLFDDTRIIEYQLEENDRAKQSWQNFLIMERRKLKVDLIEKGYHCWIKEELITVSNNQKIAVNIEGKQLQSITDFKNVKKIYPIICGFLAINDNFLRVYKKQLLNYILKAQFFLPQIGFTQNLALSQQEDVFAFYDSIKRSIQYCTNFQEQIQESSTVIHSRSLKFNEISFKKEGSVQGYSSNQSMFALSNGSFLNIYSSLTYECYLSAAIFSQEGVNPAFRRKSVKRSNTIAVNLDSSQETTKPQQITTLSLHPHKNVVAICLKYKVRFYTILFNQIRHIKDINLPNCKDLSFSPSGQFIYLSIGGKQGAKTYIYRSEDFQLVECISVGRKVDHFLWSRNDNILYGVHDKGYFWWGVESNFKTRNQSIEEFNFQVKGAFINHKDRLIVYGQHKIIQICDHRISNQVQIQQRLSKVFCQNQHYLMVTEKGQIIKCNHLDIKNNKTSTFQLNIHNKNQSINQQKNSLQIYCVRKNSILYVNQNYDVDVLEWGKPEIQKGQVVSIERKNIVKLYKQYKDYEQKINKIQQDVKGTIEIMKIQLQNREKMKEQQFKAELQDNLQRYEYVRKQKSRLENTMQENIQVYEKQTLSQVKELQKMYERKIALTTNKLLTSEQINYRNRMLAQQNLKVLQKRTGNDVQKIRQQYTKQLRKYMEEKDLMNNQIYNIKKQYESRLYDLQQQNQSLLKIYQDKSDEHINILKKNVVGWQIKYSQVLSKKDNIQKVLSEEMINIQILKERLAYIQVRRKESDRKCQFLQLQVTKMQKVLQQKNNSISCYEERINDLQKSNQILKYRVVELKNQSQPQQSQIQKLKDSMNQLQEQYDKVVKTSHQKQQMFSILKKQNQKLRQNMQRFDLRVKKVQKSYYQLYDKIMDITKSPIQQIRKQLIDLLNQSKGDSKNKSFNGVSGTQNPLGELNRIREHLQVCLHEAVDSNKRGEEQKKVQLLKKNRQNSELIKQINDLRRRVKILEAQLKQRDLQINRLKRGDPILLRANSNQKDRQSQQRDHIYSQSAKKSNPTNTNTRIKTQARETKDSFFQKSLFKSGSYWKQKRLKTEQGNRRKKSTYQIQRIDRNPSGKRLLIEGNQQVQEYKRLLQQKQTIIKQLINKIQSLS